MGSRSRTPPLLQSRAADPGEGSGVRVTGSAPTASPPPRQTPPASLALARPTAPPPPPPAAHHPAKQAPRRSFAAAPPAPPRATSSPSAQHRPRTPPSPRRRRRPWAQSQPPTTVAGRWRRPGERSHRPQHPPLRSHLASTPVPHEALAIVPKRVEPARPSAALAPHLRHPLAPDDLPTPFAPLPPRQNPPPARVRSPLPQETRRVSGEECRAQRGGVEALTWRPRRGPWPLAPMIPLSGRASPPRCSRHRAISPSPLRTPAISAPQAPAPAHTRVPPSRYLAIPPSLSPAIPPSRHPTIPPSHQLSHSSTFQAGCRE